MKAAPPRAAHETVAARCAAGLNEGSRGVAAAAGPAVDDRQTVSRAPAHSAMQAARRRAVAWLVVA